MCVCLCVCLRLCIHRDRFLVLFNHPTLYLAVLWLSVKDSWKPVVRGQRCGRAPLGRSLLDHLSPGQAPGLLHTDTDRYYSPGTLSTMDDLQAQWDPEQQRGDPPQQRGPSSDSVCLRAFLSAGSVSGWVLIGY